MKGPTDAERARLRAVAIQPRARLVYDPAVGFARSLPDGWTIRGRRRACQRRGVHLGRAGSRS